MASVAMAIAVIRDQAAAVASVAVTFVATATAVNPVMKPAAVASVALVIVAVLPIYAVATSGKSAVKIETAMTLQRNSVVETEMVLYVIRRGGNAVMRADVYTLAPAVNVVMKGYAWARVPLASVAMMAYV